MNFESSVSFSQSLVASRKRKRNVDGLKDSNMNNCTSIGNVGMGIEKIRRSNWRTTLSTKWLVSSVLIFLMNLGLTGLTSAFQTNLMMPSSASTLSGGRMATTSQSRSRSQLSVASVGASSSKRKTLRKTRSSTTKKVKCHSQQVQGRETALATLVAPRESISKEKRRRAVEAMLTVGTASHSVDSNNGTGKSSRNGNMFNDVLKGVDAQTMLELLSDGFLYPSGTSSRIEMGKADFNSQQIPSDATVMAQQKNVKRKKGRPSMVPGAMKLETMQRYCEKLAIAEIESDITFGRLSNADELTPAMSFYSSSVAVPAGKRKQGRKKQLFEKESSSIEPPMERGSSQSSKKRPAVKGRKRNNRITQVTRKQEMRIASRQEPSLAQNYIPIRKAQTKKKFERKTKTYRFKGKNNKQKNSVASLDFQRYYETELLKADEEYSIGMKIQFLVKCEHVHEGLSTHLMRLPTMEEWAEACGFVEPGDKSTGTSSSGATMTLYGEKDGEDSYQYIRPAGSDSIFEQTDPNMFLGNGLAHMAGPGRGRGRAKKPPPLKMKDFYDDSETKFSGQASLGVELDETSDLNSDNTGKREAQPKNRGTVSDFIEMVSEGREAKQRMIQCNMRLVVSIAKKYSNVGVSLQDLVQEGSLGLSRAAEKFEPLKGFKFSTYASWWIQQAVFRAIAYHSRTIRLPVHIHNLLNRVRKVRSILDGTLGRPPTNEEIAVQLGMTLEKYNKMLRLTRRSISLELPRYSSNPKDMGHASEDLLGDSISGTGSDGGSAPGVLMSTSGRKSGGTGTEGTGGISGDESFTTPEKRVDRGLFHDDLREMLEILDDDERNVVNYRYGLTDGLTRTVTIVAAQLKQSKAWVRSQESRALRKLRRPWYEKKLKEHQDALTN